jgi:hypothetical protein
MVFNTTFNNISVKYVAVSFICRGNWRVICILYMYYRRAIQQCRSRRGRDRMVVGLTTTTTCAISAYDITSKVVSLNPADGEVYSIQHM